jgi:sugar lactone lactonase YvrE
VAGVYPDGICLDADGAVWVASPLSREVLRVREGGTVTHCLRLAAQPYACMLGGPDGRMLFICTAPSVVPGEVKALKAGRIEVTQVDVPGAGRP